MAMLLNDTQEKSDLQQKVTAELREKSTRKPSIEGDSKLLSFRDTDDPDYSRRIKNNSLNFWISAILAAIIVASVVVIVVKQ